MDKGILMTPSNAAKMRLDIKTQTRRPLKPQPEGGIAGWHESRAVWRNTQSFPGQRWTSPWQVGDRLYVKEKVEKDREGKGYAIYASDGQPVMPYLRWRWKRGYLSPLHMPRVAARDFYRVMDIRIERVQDISDSDALAEGCGTEDDMGGQLKGRVRIINARHDFRILWDSIYGAYGPEAWAKNPWVWCVTFKSGGD